MVIVIVIVMVLVMAMATVKLIIIIIDVMVFLIAAVMLMRLVCTGNGICYCNDFCNGGSHVDSNFTCSGNCNGYAFV